MSKSATASTNAPMTATHPQTLPIVRPTREAMMKCVARFEDLKRDQLPDADMEGYRRTFASVVGYYPNREPAGSDQIKVSGPPKPCISHLKPGFWMTFVEAEPGNGVMMHAHDANETFVVMEGKWCMEWEGEKGKESVELGPLDSFSFPAFVHRQFHCVSSAEGKKNGLLLVVNAGDEGISEYSPESLEKLAAAGKVS